MCIYQKRYIHVHVYTCTVDINKVYMYMNEIAMQMYMHVHVYTMYGRRGLRYIIKYRKERESCSHFEE